MQIGHELRQPALRIGAHRMIMIRKNPDRMNLNPCLQGRDGQAIYKISWWSSATVLAKTIVGYIAG